MDDLHSAVRELAAAAEHLGAVPAIYRHEAQGDVTRAEQRVTALLDALLAENARSGRWWTRCGRA